MEKFAKGFILTHQKYWTLLKLKMACIALHFKYLNICNILICNVFRQHLTCWCYIMSVCFKRKKRAINSSNHCDQTSACWLWPVNAFILKAKFKMNYNSGDITCSCGCGWDVNECINVVPPSGGSWLINPLVEKLVAVKVLLCIYLY